MKAAKTSTSSERRTVAARGRGDLLTGQNGTVPPPCTACPTTAGHGKQGGRPANEHGVGTPVPPYDSTVRYLGRAVPCLLLLTVAGCGGHHPPPGHTTGSPTTPNTT